MIAIAAIIGLTGAAITYYGRDTYFVGFDRTRSSSTGADPGGVLWIQPELVERPALTRSTVPASFADEIEAGKVEPTLADAHRYLTNVATRPTAGAPADATIDHGHRLRRPPPPSATCPGTDRRWALAGATPSSACWSWPS